MPFMTPAELPIGTFCRQLRIPDHPTWVGVVTGALRGACFPSEWEQSHDGITPEAAAARWKQMYYEYLSSTCEGTYNNCRQFPASSGIIQYAPNDPFNTPEYIPPGYVLPPWYTNAAIPLPGVRPGDAMVNLLSMAVVPAVVLSEGLPRFTIQVSGTGEMELELVKIPQAGYLLIQAPDATSPVQLTDLTSVSITDVVSLAFILALFGLPGDYSFVDTEVVELEFENEGEHTVTCTFVPSIGGEEILGFGGGLRSVTLCGLSVPGEETEFMRFRLNPANHCQTQVQYEPEGDWETIIDSQGCCGQNTNVEKRLNPDTYWYEINDGSGWTQDPDDPRLHVMPILPSGSMDRCQASKNAYEQMIEVMAACFTVLEAGGTLLQIAASIAAILIILVTRPGDSFWLVPIVLQFIAEIRNYELAAFISQFTQVYAEPLRKSLYCHIETDGSYTDDGIAAIIADMEAVNFTLGGVNLVLPMIKMTLYAWQAPGLSNAAKILTSPVTSGECDGFDCGGCDVNNWIIRYPESGHFGEITAVSPGGDYIEVVSTGINTNNKYYVYIQTESPLVQGCAIHSIQLIGGDMGSTDPFCNLFPNAIDDNNLQHVVIFPNEICVNCIQWQSDTPFALRVTFDPCP